MRLVLQKKYAMSGKYKELQSSYLKEGEIPLQEYPRPHFKRDSYLNLNGVWDFCFAKDISSAQFDQKILVPFSPETELSKIKRTPQKGEYLFYRKEVNLPKGFRKEFLILHFGAVDQELDLFIDNVLVYSHDIPLLPFEVDISKYVQNDTFEIMLQIQDLTEKGHHVLGKQKTKRGGIWYTPQSGVMQTIWLEGLPSNHLKEVEIRTDFDQEEVTFIFTKIGNSTIYFTISINGKEIKALTTNENEISISLPKCFKWSPHEPHLYDVTFNCGDDTVSSYFAFRKVERKIHSNGYAYLYLNNEPIFISGVLDQGYYSDGFLTAPSDQALIDDILLLKKMGFNLTRKHIKVEPYRFYYHCDRLGMLVMQDMINLKAPNHFNFNGARAMFLNKHPNDEKTKLFGIKNKVQEDNYLKALRHTIKLYKHFPSIISWVPFNEGWGQFRAKEVTDLVLNLDNARLIDHASGWSDQKVSDFFSMHIYFKKLHARPKDLHNRIFAISEFGGYSYKIPNHSFNLKKTFGYRLYQTQFDLELGLEKLYLDEALPLINQGLNVLIYTQLSDVEDEVNGLITYDRKVVKVEPKFMKNINKRLYEYFNEFIEKP